MPDKEDIGRDTKMTAGKNGDIKSSFTRSDADTVHQEERAGEMSSVVDNFRTVSSQRHISYVGWGAVLAIGACLWVAFFLWLGFL